MIRSEIIVGLDIGTTKVCTIVGEFAAEGRIDVLGVGMAPSTGLRKGIVVDIDSTVRAIKQSVRETEGMSEVDGLARELEIGTPIFMTEDAQEGPSAFSQKRTPEFKGK